MVKKVEWKSLAYIFSIIFVLGFFMIAFISIADEVRENELQTFDDAIISYVQGHVSEQATELMLIITFLGSVKWITFAVAAGSAALFFMKKISLSLFLILSSGMGAVFNITLKMIFQRERPDIQPLIMEQGFSFPSGHSMGSFIFYGAVAYVIVNFVKKRSLRALGVLFSIVLIGLIGLSRVYLGVHFPSDIIGGFSAGGVWLIICMLLYRFYEFRKKAKGEAVK